MNSPRSLPAQRATLVVLAIALLLMALGVDAVERDWKLPSLDSFYQPGNDDSNAVQAATATLRPTPTITIPPPPTRTPTRPPIPVTATP